MGSPSISILKKLPFNFTNIIKESGVQPEIELLALNEGEIGIGTLTRLE